MRRAPGPALPSTDPWAWFFMAPKGMASSPWGQRMPAHHRELTPDHSVTLDKGLGTPTPLVQVVYIVANMGPVTQQI